ncbi:2-oxoglutarate and iron-dependent oxygenase domain-containing protein 3 isoform X2 [Rhinolophus sinicus]|uniref:2-oxoglutarate and iron-dependent oxygenase domain-containing protein 3 isoform X2 n=1 Tax=Rhinolophus sinicus TaxID=89399 RepID=UPI003D7A2313
MAPQRRGAPKAHEGSGATERRRPSSLKSVRASREPWRKWPSAALLGASATLAALLLWGSLGGDDGVTEVLAHRSEVLPGRFIEVPCSEDYDSHRRFEEMRHPSCNGPQVPFTFPHDTAQRRPPSQSSTLRAHVGLRPSAHTQCVAHVFPGCSPTKCGRGVTDAVITRDEARRIRSIAEKGLSLGGSDGGASILDLHSGALSVGKHFVNLYRYFGDKIENIFSEEDFQLYRTEARTAHDEYWHAHVDKVTYGSFDYTSLLYLSDYLDDFGGGRFVFMEEGANKTVEPRAGRVSFFTSGSENLHRVEKVHWGTRYAVTIAFSCNPDHGIADPAFT